MLKLCDLGERGVRDDDKMIIVRGEQPRGKDTPGISGFDILQPISWEI